MLVCFPTDEKSDSSLPLYVLPLYSLLAPEKQAKVKDLLSQWAEDLPDLCDHCLKSQASKNSHLGLSISLNGPVGRLGWDWGRPGLSCGLPDVPLQRLGEMISDSPAGSLNPPWPWAHRDAAASRELEQTLVFFPPVFGGSSSA